MRHEADREYEQDPQNRAETADLSERITAEIEKLVSSSAMGETDKSPIALLLERTECISGECPFSLIVTDRRGQIVFCNERTLQLFGYTIGEMIQKRFHDLSDPRLRKIPQRILGHMNDGLTPKFSGHLVLRGRKGNSLPCQVNIQPLHVRGESDHFLFFVQLSSEFKRKTESTDDAETPETPSSVVDNIRVFNDPIIPDVEKVKKPPVEARHSDALLADGQMAGEKIGLFHSGNTDVQITMKNEFSDDNPETAKPGPCVKKAEVARMSNPETDEPIVVMGSFPWGDDAREHLEETPPVIESSAAYSFPTVEIRHPMLDGDPFLQNMIPLRASDLHLKAGFPPLFRMDNLKLHIAENMEPLSDRDISRFLVDLLGRERFEKILKGQEIDFVFASNNRERFRMNAFLSMGSPTLSVRRINSLIPEIGGLGLPPVMRKLAFSSSGLLLITGPTGSGKSTTLASIIEEINQNRNVHIITLEDPVEYVFSSKKALITQRQIGKDTQSFQEALSRVLRQDPDIIMIGEMRDLETISLAVTAAETGHLVLATLHTRDAPGSIDRIVDIFPAAQQEQIKAEVANTLLGVCSQQLLPKTGGGRVLATEMLVGTNGVRNRIRVGGTQQLRNTMLTSPEDGMFTFEQNLAGLVNKKLISLETALAHAGDSRELKRFLES